MTTLRYIFRQIAKVLPKDDLAQGLIIPLIVLLPIFGFVQIFNSEHFNLNLEIFIGLYFVLTTWFFIDNSYGRDQHKKVLEGKRLKQLSNLGFVIENIGDYWGYKGYYKDFYFRIFYNWNTILINRNNFREICIMLYYSPPKLANDSVNIKLLNDLNKKYSNGLLTTKQFVIIFKMAHLEIHAPYRFFGSFNSIKKRIETALEIASNENLRPIQESEINKLINQDPLNYGPNITTFWETKGILDK